ELAARAGYDPWGLVRALEKMKEAGFETSPSGFNSHPPTDRRLIHVRNKAAEVSTRY
ncbi:MAG: peptidase M48, partial [Acetomicrobium sp.]|nr:peptidase M48 [Acetomicrobium sp.]